MSLLIDCFLLHFSTNQKLSLAHQQMTADYEKLRQEEAEKSAKLQELMSVPYSLNTPIISTNNNHPKQTNNKLASTPGAKKCPSSPGGNDCPFGFGNLRRSGATHCRRPSLAAAVVDNEPVPGDEDSEHTSNRDQLERDEQNLLFQRRLKLSKLHKNLLNRRNQAGVGSPAGSPTTATSYRQLIEELEREQREREELANGSGTNKAKGKSLMSCLASTIPLALPTLQLHLLLSLTMVLLTHRCPQYLIIL